VISFSLSVGSLTNYGVITGGAFRRRYLRANLPETVVGCFDARFGFCRVGGLDFFRRILARAESLALGSDAT
jgi:hypothetical protein